MHGEVPRANIDTISAQSILYYPIVQFIPRALNLAELMMIGLADAFFAPWQMNARLALQSCGRSRGLLHVLFLRHCALLAVFQIRIKPIEPILVDHMPSRWSWGLLLLRRKGYRSDLCFAKRIAFRVESTPAFSFNRFCR